MPLLSCLISQPKKAKTFSNPPSTLDTFKVDVPRRDLFFKKLTYVYVRMKNVRLPLSCPVLVDRQHSQATAAVVWGLVAMLIPAADRIIRGNGSVRAAAGAEGGRDDHENQHHDGYLIRGVASQIVLMHGEGHPEPFRGGCVSDREWRAGGIFEEA